MKGLQLWDSCRQVYKIFNILKVTVFYNLETILYALQGKAWIYLVTFTAAKHEMHMTSYYRYKGQESFAKKTHILVSGWSVYFHLNVRGETPLNEVVNKDYWIGHEQLNARRVPDNLVLMEKTWCEKYQESMRWFINTDVEIWVPHHTQDTKQQQRMSALWFSFR